MTWQQISSDTGELELPFGAAAQQTDAQILDIDNDEISDFVLVNRNLPPAVVWYRSDGSGWTRHVVEASSLPLEAGGTNYDVDGDGDLDIVVGEGALGNHIYWWENPFPFYDPATPWTVHVIKDSGQNKHHDVIFGDVDGDGAGEFVFWNGEKSLRIAEIPADPAAGPWPFSAIFSDPGPNEGLAIADVNLDGVDDIVGAGRWFEYGGATWTVHEIDPTMNFTRTAAGQLVPGGRPEILFVIGDVSGPIDGTSFLTMYEWDGAGWIGTSLLPELTHAGHSLDIVDLNNDGLLDIFNAEMTLGGNPDAAGRVYYGDGTGEFSVQEFSAGLEHHQSKIGDLDRDGDLDILGKPFTDGSPAIHIWLNKEIDAGVLPLDQWVRHNVDPGQPWLASHALWGDFDLDGSMDIVSGGWIYHSQGGDYSLPWSRTLIGAPLNNVALVHDFDNDGDLDLLGTDGLSQSPTHPGSTKLYWGRNEGDGTFTVLENITPGVASDQGSAFVQGIAPIDVQNDGVVGIAISWNFGEFGQSGIDLLTVPNDPSASTWPLITISPVSEGEELGLDDIDGDGDIDIFQGSGWLQNSHPIWTRHESTTLIAQNAPYDDPDRVSMADIDGDGDQDAVIGLLFETQSIPTDLVWLEHPDDPTQEWPLHVIGSGIGGGFSMSVGDVDNDGDTDVVLGEHVGQTRMLIFENVDGGSSWVEHVVDDGVGTDIDHHDGALLVDFENDGDLDILSLGWHNQKVWLYENKVLEPGDISDIEPPAAPTDLVATPYSSGQVDLDWRPSFDNRGIFQYRVLRDGEVVGTTAGLHFADMGLLPNTTYSYTVIGVDLSGNESPPADPASASTPSPDLSPPTPPTELEATANALWVELTWTPAADDRGVVGYLLRRNGVDLITLEAGATSHTDQGLTPDSWYDYELIAFDADGNSTDPLDAQVSALTLPPPTGLWAAYGFEDSGSAIVDASIYGNDATLQPSAVLQSNGHTGNALEVNGGVGHVDLGNLDIPAEHLTLMAWINADDFDTNDARILSKSTSTQSAAHVWMLSTISGPHLRLRLRTDDGSPTSTLIGADGTLVAGTWHHVAATYDGVAMRLYQDGVEVGSAPRAGAVFQAPNVDAYIGANPGAGDKVFDGRIDDLKIFGRALTPAEIAVEMQLPVDPPQPDTERPTSPGVLTALATSTTSIQLSWSASTDNRVVASYVIARDGTDIATVPASQLAFSDINLQPGSTHSYTVVAVDAALNVSIPAGPVSETTFAPDLEPPTVPGSLAANATASTSVALTWIGSTDNVAVASYIVTRDGNDIANLAASAISYTDDSATPDTTHAYSVTAVDTSGNAATAGPLAVVTPPLPDPDPDVEPPTAPGSFSASATSSSTVALSWLASTDNVAIGSYVVTRDGVDIATLAASASSYIDLSATPETTHLYWVTAFDTSDNVATAGPLAVLTPPVPEPIGDLWAAYDFSGAGPALVDRSGNANDGTLAGTASVVPNGQFGEAVELTGGTGRVDLGGLDVAGDQLTIAAWVNADDFGIRDARIVSKSTSAAANDHLWMLSTISKQRLRFRLQTDDGNPTTTLIGTGGALTAGTWHFVAATYDGVAMRLFIDGTEVGATGKTGAVATDSSIDAWIGNNPGTGNQAFDGRIDELRIFTRALSATELVDLATVPVEPPILDTEPPSTPGSLSGGALDHQTVELTWTASNDNVAVASYLVTRDDVDIATVPAASTSYLDDTATPDTTHLYWVTAADTSGNLATAGPLTVVTPPLPPDVEPPTTPDLFTAVATGPNTIYLSWTASTDNDVVGSYLVVRDGVLLIALPSSQLSFTDNGLAEGSTHEYTVAAVDGSGNPSAPAGPVSATTFAIDDEPPTAPGSFSGSATSFSSVALSWVESSDNAAVASYLVTRDGVDIASLLAPATAYLDDTATPDTTHLYWVTAIDTSGNETTAGPLSVTTPPPPEPTNDQWAAYDFSGPGPTVIDVSGNNNSGALRDAASIVPNGRFGGAVELTGGAGSVDLGGLDIDGDQLTIAAWINADDFGIYDARIVSKSTSAAANDHLWMLSTISGQRLRFRLKTDDGNSTATLIGTGGALTAGTWHFVAATYDGVAMRLFIDGVEVGATGKTGAIATDPTIDAWIGDNPGTGAQPFDGRIDELRIHTRAMDAAELAALALVPVN